MTTATSHRNAPGARWRPFLLPAWLALLASAAGGAAPLRAQGVDGAEARELDPQLAALLAEEREEADRLRRRGELDEARALLREHVHEDPQDARSRWLLAACGVGVEPPEQILAEGSRALEDALGRAGSPGAAAEVARGMASLLTRLGRAQEALDVLERIGPTLRPVADPRDAWALGQAREEAGRRASALEAYGAGAVADAGGDWRQLLAKGRCERRLGRLAQASVSLVAADRAALAAGSAEPDVLAELAALYFEADGEVAIDVPEERLPAVKYREALAIHPFHEASLLGLFELHRFNWRRRSRSADSLLAELLARYPRSPEAWLAETSLALDNGHLPRARVALATLAELAPGRRAVRAERAALAWVEHRREEARSELDLLAAEDSGDPAPERTVGTHLIELYRFAEALPFLESASERAPHDPEVWTALGRALANSGDEARGLEALRRATAVAAGRRNAWRDNTRMVLERIEREYAEAEHGEHTFVWEPQAADVLAAYVVPFYASARAELARRYGFTPGQVRIEFFGRHADFSVRSTGFQGFPALGVCFGPVVTAVSPLAELRGTFSWARTAYHEYTHVIHLGLSHNRCPRWITEGIATWEETREDPGWSRNMRRDLVDAHANGTLIPVRELNAAFRGPRILFGYYQGGLLCEMLIAEHGFPPLIRLLEAFDRGLDLDAAFDEVYGLTPAEIDRRFLEFVDGQLAGLRIEPRWEPSVVSARRFALPQRPPEDAGRAEWADGWCTVAWGSWQQGGRVDAEEALRLARSAGELPLRGRLLEGEILLAKGQRERAADVWEAALADGAEDFRVRMALGSLAYGEGERERAEAHFLAAERAFPGFPDEELSAELSLAELYEEQQRTDEAMEARERWLSYDSGDFVNRLRVAGWHQEAGRYEAAERRWAEANEIDPFHTSLHRSWGLALVELGRWDEALREFDVALRIPPELDADETEPTDERRAELLALRARAALELGREEAARADLDAALALDPACAAALELSKRLQS